MLRNEEMSDDAPALSTSDENEIFKSLSHQIRRNIIKSLGNQRELSFTEIKNEFASMESPTLAYHLKSLKLLLEQSGDVYRLTDIGQTTLLLLDKIDQSDRLKKMKKNFLLANIITSICWVLVQISVMVILSFEFTVTNQIIIVIILNVVPQISYQYIWRLFSKSFRYNPGKKPGQKKLKKT